MDIKNNKPKRSFVPQPIGETIKKVNRNFASKFGKVEFIIHTKWPEIVGTYFNEFSEPKNITNIASYENELGEKTYKRNLNVDVAPAAALEFQHFKDKILDKINSFFGYKAILDIRIHQNYINKRNNLTSNNIDKKKLSTEERNTIKNEVEKMGNKDLKKSLIDLGINILKENK